MTEELKVVLRRSEQHSGFGFSLLGSTGPPHVIYDIVENSPAADCGSVEAGDVILKVNGTDVHRYTTKEVLKCLRLSEQLVTLELKRDPKLKARIKEQLANTQSPHYVDIESPNIYDYSSSHSANSSPNHRPNNSKVSSPAAASGLRFKSPTHLPSLRQNSSPLLASGSTTTTTHTHSRNSSASSTKIKVVETTIQTTSSTITTSAAPTSPTGSDATSPTHRPSRIPQARKCPAPKPVPVLHSPQNKRPRSSQIPTKASNGNGNGNGSAHNSQLPPQSLQHSNSYSGSPVTRPRISTEREPDTEREPEPNSAPPQSAKAPRFEAFMMTGDLILNLSRTPQTSNHLTTQAKKVDSLRDSPIRQANSRMNGALAPRASGESSPTSSSSVDSPTNTSSDSVKREAKLQRKQQPQQQQQHQQQRDSINNSYNRKDSLTNDTLLMCEELERDEEGEYVLEEDSKHQRQRQHQQRYRQQQQQQRYEYYQNDDELDEEQEQEVEAEAEAELEREEDQTHYDITNIETYQSGMGRGDEDDSDRQCLVEDDDDDDDAYDEEENDAGDEDYSTNSLGSGSTKQRLRALKQRAATRQQQQRNRDAVDCAARMPGYSASGSTSSTTVKSEAAGGMGIPMGVGLGAANTSQDETSFSVPTSPISLSTPLIDKETANSVPTSPEPSSLAPESSSGAAGVVVVRRHHNGHVVRKCDAAGFRTSKSEDHLQQIQREGIAAVIPIDIDEDVNSSLNTLLDTRQDSEDSQSTATTASSVATIVHNSSALNNNENENSRNNNTAATTTTTIGNNNSSETENETESECEGEGESSVTTATTATRTNKKMIGSNCSNKLNYILCKKASDRDRIVWTYNAPLQPHQLQQIQQQQQQQQLHQQQQQQIILQQQQQQKQQQQQQQQQQQFYGQQSHSNSHSSSISSSPQHSAAGSPASPTSVSSSVMSSSGSKGALGAMGGNGQAADQQQQQLEQREQGGTASLQPPSGMSGLLACPGTGNGGGGVGCGNDLSVSEAISNISSPDYQDDDNLLSSRDILGGMVLSDPSDSDSTILVSDGAALQRQQLKQQLRAQQQQQRDRDRDQSEHKVVIQVRGMDNNGGGGGGGSAARSEDDVVTLTDEQPHTTMSSGAGAGAQGTRDASPPVSDDGSDVESLHSYHYSPKAVDMPSAIRLAKRLYSLDGFKKSDVSRHLSKNNDFSRAVADEYLKHFTFEKKSLDQSLREFLQQFSLSGETQERERVLVHFSKRFLDCNPGTFNSQDAVHTLTCAIMLLNTDLHGQNMNRKMSCAEFVDNLADLNDGENFPKDILKLLYQAIKTKPLEWALDDDAGDLQQRGNNALGNVGQNPFLDAPEVATAVEYKKGYVMRKCCYDSSYKKTPFGKRSWKMFYCTLRDLVLYLHKDEHGFRKSQMSDNLHNAIRIHHALATKANDYTKKQHVFRLQTSDQAEYLFQTSDSKELHSWVETINYVCAAISAPPLEGGVGSQKRFQRPLLPSKQTKLMVKEQLESHEVQLAQLEQELNEHKKGPIPSKGLPLQNYKEKESYLQYELRRYRTYVSILSAKMLADQQQLELQALQPTQAILDEEADTFPVGNSCSPTTPPSINIQEQQQKEQQRQPHSSNRYSQQPRASGSSSSSSGGNVQQDIG
ncbi:serine-rich adhesin for platelets isoform X2 [Drosophila miranda]|uniref:serine-rich adhesin for platelets isoform X2 n=1 Tax=Drosophila miranda TaxID=7229 RepID=UPI0007E69AD2|nr:serine-rich adhesin for platelets isoform X2 [Drosophila miranda]